MIRFLSRSRACVAMGTLALVLVSASGITGAQGLAAVRSSAEPAVSPSAPPASGLKVIDVGTNATNGWYAVNDSGELAGFVETGSGRDTLIHAASWNSGIVKTAGTPNGLARGIDDAGDLFGVHQGTSGNSPTRWSASGAQYIDTGRAVAFDSLNGGFENASSNGTALGVEVCKQGSCGFVASPPKYVGTTLPGLSFSGGVNNLGHVASSELGATAPTVQFYNGRSVVGTGLSVVPGAHPLNNLDQIVGLERATISGLPVYVPALWDAGRLMRLPELSTDDPARGLDTYPEAINDSGTIVGSSYDAMGSQVAVIWQNGKIKTLNSMLPPGSPWNLTTGIDISNSYVLGTGTLAGVPHYFLIQIVTPIVVNESSDQSDPVAALKEKRCDVDPNKPGDQCTLRAAIQVANATPDISQSIEFDVPKGNSKLPTITVNSALPAIKNPETIDASTEPGSNTGFPAVVVFAGNTGQGVNGIEIDGGDTVIKGLLIANFHGDGLLLKGDGAKVSNCGFFHNATGLEVASNDDTVGGSQANLNLFFDNGDFEALEAYQSSLKGKTATPSELEGSLVHLGAGVLVREAGVSNLTVSYNLLGVHGSELSSYFPSDDPGGPLTSTFGVLIAPKQGPVSNVTLQSNLISGDGLGITIIPGFSGSVSNVIVTGNRIGPTPNGGAYEPFGNLIGLIAGGKVSGLTLTSNEIEGNIVGVYVDGQEVTRLTVQRNVIGDDKNLSDLEDPKKSALGLHNILGMVLADVSGATIGGGSKAAGNAIEGNLVDIVMGGKHTANNTIDGNGIGMTNPPSGNIDSQQLGDLGSLFGILDIGGTNDTIGSAAAENTIKGTVLGVSFFGTDKNTIQGNLMRTNAVAVVGFGSSRNQIGGSSANAGNTISNNVLGILMANVNPDPRELKDSHLDNAGVTQKDREQAFTEPNEEGDLNLINATSTADLGPKSVDALPEVGFGNIIQGNQIGGAAGEHQNGNDVAMLLLGDLHQTLVGGPVSADANVIAENHQAGVWVAGTTTHYPTVRILRNSVFQNDDFTGPFEAVPGLGIDLITGTDTAGVPGHDFGPDEIDGKSPGSGPDGWQNYSEFKTATITKGMIDVSGTIQSVPNSNITIEFFADRFCNPYKYGEGEQWLASMPVSVDASGKAHFSDAFAQKLTGAPYIAATATSITTNTTGGTSEFSKCTKLQ